MFNKMNMTRLWRKLLEKHRLQLKSMEKWEIYWSVEKGAEENLMKRL
jgi:hypothetical protein